MSKPSRQIDPLPADADASVSIVHNLRAAGHEALLAGGCVRDLLLGQAPEDYDVATNAPPERIKKLFRPTRLVGQAFGVVLVRRMHRWVEVATFRSDGTYSDGRRPDSVVFADARQDAQRRDFTINGMFLEPDERRVIDTVGGQADLAARVIRCIGEPAARFAEDYLRLLRAVRFAARLDFAIEPATLAAIRVNASAVAKVSMERIREELERMLGQRGRATALALLLETGLLRAVFDVITPASAEALTNDVRAAATELFPRLADDAPFEPALACILRSLANPDVHEFCRRLTCSNEQRELVAWLVRHQADLDRPDALSLAAFKRLLAHPAFAWLRALSEARSANAELVRRAIDSRVSSIDPAQVAPPPFVTGDDITDRGVPAGPIYKRVLDELYTRQLNEEIVTRAQALAAMEELLRT